MAQGMFKIHAGDFQLGTTAQWLYNHFRILGEGNFLREKIDIEQIKNFKILEENNYSKGKLNVICELKDGRQFLASMNGKLFTAIQSSIFDASIGKTVKVPFFYRPWKRSEKIIFNILMSPLYLILLLILFSPFLPKSAKHEKNNIEKYPIEYVQNIEIPKRWDKVTVNGDGSEFSFVIWYKNPPSFKQARDDTVSMVRAVLIGIMARGHSPTKEMIDIRVRAMSRGGETGVGVITYGKASYDFSRDKLTFTLK